jgi:site-specific recombinase XerD
MKLTKLKQQFIEHLINDMGRSKKTIENYNRYLDRFLSFSKVIVPSDITEKQINGFRLYLNQQPGAMVGGRVELMKHNTCNYHLITLRMFLKFINERGIKSFSPDLIKLVKTDRKFFSQISPIDFEKLLNAPNQKTLEGKRDKVIIELLFSTGLRTAELCGLSIEGVDFSRSELSVCGKENDRRIIFISNEVQYLLKSYFKNRKDTSKAMFVRHGRKVNDGGDLRISPRAVQRLIKKHSVQVGIVCEVSPQIIRRSLATKLIKDDTDLSLLQEILGHKNISTTKACSRSLDNSL